MTKILKSNAAAMADHAAEDFTLFPCRAPDATAKDKRGNLVSTAKRPKKGLKWRLYKHSARKVVAKYGKTVNIAAALQPGQLVVDFDPRNGSEASKQRFLDDLALDGVEFDENEIVRYRTPSGGEHWYMNCDPSIKIQRDKPEYPGIEFISTGGYVLVAGSSNGKARYELIEGSPPLAERTTAPAAMLKLIERKTTDPKTYSESGDFTDKQLARILEGIDPDKFACKGSYQDWLKILAASHYATAGDGIDEAAEWSARSPDFPDGDDDTRAKWETFGLDRESAVRAGTLWHYVKESGNTPSDFFPVPERTTPEDDFADDLPVGEVSEPKKIFDFDPPKPSDRDQEKIRKMNRCHAVIKMGGDAFILGWERATRFPGTLIPTYMNQADFKLIYKNLFITLTSGNGEDELDAEEKTVPLADYWLSNRHRKTFDGVAFDSREKRVTKANQVNLWNGFNIQPAPGDWSLMQNHILEVLAKGNRKHFDVIVRWLAWKIQHPTEKNEVALCFIGKKGTGKGALTKPLEQMFGPHAKKVTSQQGATGRFNAHLSYCALLISDEAVWPGRKAEESTMKGYITEDNLMIEPKGIDMFDMPNRLSLIYTANPGWAVPVGEDERRFAVFDVSDIHMQDRKYFTPLFNQMEKQGGTAAMLYDLLHMDLTGYHPRWHYPRTTGSVNQQQQNDAKHIAWWYDVLTDGVLPGTMAPQFDSKVIADPARARAQDMIENARKRFPILNHMTNNAWSKFFKEMGGERSRYYGGTHYKFPSLRECKAIFYKAGFKGYEFEDSSETDWDFAIDDRPEDEAAIEAANAGANEDDLE